MNMEFDLALAKKVNNYIADATDNGTGNDKFDSTTVMEWECPAGKRWYLLGGYIYRDVSSTINMETFDAADKNIQQLGVFGAATGRAAFPNIASSVNQQFPVSYIILEAGEYVKMFAGTAQGAAAYAACPVLEVDI